MCAVLSIIAHRNMFKKLYVDCYQTIKTILNNHLHSNRLLKPMLSTRTLYPIRACMQLLKIRKFIYIALWKN